MANVTHENTGKMHPSLPAYRLETSGIAAALMAAFGTVMRRPVSWRQL